MDRRTRASLRRALGRAVSVAVVAWILSGLVRAQGTAEAALVLAAVVLSLLSLPVEVLAASGWGRDRCSLPGGARGMAQVAPVPGGLLVLFGRVEAGSGGSAARAVRSVLESVCLGGHRG